MKQVEDNSAFHWPCPRMQANHRNSQTVLVTWRKKQQIQSSELGHQSSGVCSQTPGVHVKGKHGFLSSKWRVLADAFARERGNSQETGDTFVCCGSAATLPGWLQSSFFHVFPMEAQETGKETQCSWATMPPGMTAWLWECIRPSLSTRDSYSPRDPHLEVYDRWLLTAMYQTQNVAGEQVHTCMPWSLARTANKHCLKWAVYRPHKHVWKTYLLGKGHRYMKTAVLVCKTKQKTIGRDKCILKLQ